MIFIASSYQARDAKDGCGGYCLYDLPLREVSPVIVVPPASLAVAAKAICCC